MSRIVILLALLLTGCNITIESKNLDLTVPEGDFTPAFHLHLEDSKITIPVQFMTVPRSDRYQVEVIEH